MILAGAHAGAEAAGPLPGRGRGGGQAPATRNIVQIHHIGEHDGLPFLELEYVAGGSLAEQLDGTPLAAASEPPSWSRRWPAPCAAAHAAGHRPPRPEAGATCC